MNLPESVSLHICDACNFAFNSPRNVAAYDEFYKANTNDILGTDTDLTESEVTRYQSQISHLRPALEDADVQRIADIGCGQAGLLRKIKKTYPYKICHAVDPNVNASLIFDKDLVYSSNWRELDQKFNLIILSHVVEHILDLQDFCSITKLLAPRGKIYLEVPDASRYHHFPRREFLYYFDRLHVNHFTPQSLDQLVQSWGLHVETFGHNDFEYKDGNSYPAIYAVVARDSLHVINIRQDIRLANTLPTYITNESRRMKSVREELKGQEQVVVYGFGDNFFKAIGAGGPLEGIDILAVIDARHQALKKTPYGCAYVFLGLDACIEQFPDAAYIITVSWGSARIKQDLHVRGLRKLIEI
jgi:SAM-dependent methyltransferase